MARVKRARAKFVATVNDGGNVVLEARYDPSVPEDVAFSNASPRGTLDMDINNPELDGFFVDGQAYYIDIISVDDANAAEEDDKRARSDAGGVQVIDQRRDAFTGEQRVTQGYTGESPDLAANKKPSDVK